MKVIVCGSRLFKNGEHIFARLDSFHAKTPITMLIEGGQRTYDPKTHAIVGGVDYWAGRWAKKNKIPWRTENAEWKRYGKSAGPIRNLSMIIKYQPDAVIAFPGGNGTSDMVRQAKQHKIPVTPLA